MAEQRPLLGILVSPRRIKRLSSAGTLSSESLHLDAAQQLGLRAYLFRLEDVNLSNRRIRGFARDAQKHWTVDEFAWPDVLYEYGVQRHPRRLASVLKELRRSTLLINNSQGCGKWQCHRILAGFSDTVGYLPDAVKYRNPNDLRSMLNRHHAVFTKPEWGWGGQGILRVELIDDSLYRCNSTGGERLRNPMNFDEVIEHVRKAADYGPFVIQAEIPLISIENRRADIRLMMYKDRNGHWGPAVSRLRIGKPNHYVTNIHQGADLLYLDEGLKIVLPERQDIDELIPRIHAAAELILTRLETGLGAMGEIGLDLALDKDLKIWFLEANARPQKTIPKPSDLKVGLPRKYTAIMEYALYLWERSQQPQPIENGIP